MTWDNVWVRIAVVLVGSIGAVALVTRLTIWLVYCFKAAPNRSGSEEMDLAEKADRERDLLEGKSTYTSYEQWRKDILSDKPISEIVGRVPEGFFDKKPEPSKGGAGISGSLGPQGPQADIARQRLTEMQERLSGEGNQRVKDRLAEVRAQMLAAPQVYHKAPFYHMAKVLKPYCQNCHGTGSVSVISADGIPTSGVPCSWCRKL